MVDFNVAKGPLQISKRQFEQLDSLDGTKDDKISEDIFSLALKVRENSKELVVDDTNKTLIHKIKDILGTAVTNWITPGPGGAIAVKDNDNDDGAWNIHKLQVGEVRESKEMDSSVSIKNDGPFKGLNELGKQAIDYFLRNGTMEGFSSKGLVSNEFTIESINVEFEYNDGGNDFQSIDKDGIVQNNKKADSIVVTITTSEGQNVYKTTVSRKLAYNMGKDVDKPLTGEPIYTVENYNDQGKMTGYTHYNPDGSVSSTGEFTYDSNNHMISSNGTYRDPKSGKMLLKANVQRIQNSDGTWTQTTTLQNGTVNIQTGQFDADGHFLTNGLGHFFKDGKQIDNNP